LHLDGRAASAEDVRAITRPLLHRGPDGEGVYVDGPVGLGHRRLSILDLSEAGKQPMPSESSRYWITFNGEIYNFLELKKELEGKGHHFKNDSDTEVILAAYERWGADCVFKFNGMWAFAIWDSQTRELFLSRDRFGIKPLHYLLEGNRFAFASELKSFLHLRDFTPRENEEEMSRALLTGEMEAGVDSLIAGVKRLPGGHHMRITAGGNVKIWKWWRTLEHIPQVPQGHAAQTEAFRELFFDACRLRLRSDVPVATCLSGGMDSSSVLCTVAKIRKSHSGNTERLSLDSQRAFVATYPGTPWDEREFAEAAVAQAGAEAHYLPISTEMAAEAIEQYTYDFEGLSNSLLVPLWLIYRELRRNKVYVSLDGHGADEILAGYPNQIKEVLAAEGNLLRSPLRTADLMRTVQGMSSSGTVSSGDLSDLLVMSDPFIRGAAKLANRAVKGLSSRPPPMRTPSGSWVAVPSTRLDPTDDEEKRALKDLNALDRILYLDFHHKVLPGILRNFDRCSMAHGVEMRMPFMDYRLVTFAFGLPPEAKVSGGLSKRVLRDAMKWILPEKVRMRTGKVGFVSPMPNWFNAGLGDWVMDQVQSPAFLEASEWNGGEVRDFCGERHKAKNWNNNDTKRVWRFLMAHAWRKSFILGHKPAAPAASATA
jgi:asparagine synthase (glutamine-hydrolysing)